MLNLEVKLFTHGKEVSVDSLVEAILESVRSSVREELSPMLGRPENRTRESLCEATPQAPRQAVSVREAARLLSISPRTVDKYVALKVIRTIRIGRRVLIPMKSVNEVASNGVPPHWK